MDAIVATAQANKASFEPLRKMTLFVADDMKTAVDGNRFGPGFEDRFIGARHYATTAVS